LASVAASFAPDLLQDAAQEGVALALAPPVGFDELVHVSRPLGVAGLRGGLERRAPLGQECLQPLLHALAKRAPVPT
jgi:hypothetical protein